MMSSKTIVETREELQRLASIESDPDLKFALLRLDDDIDSVQLFRSAGRYTEAKYAAEYLRAHLCDFQRTPDANRYSSQLLADVREYMDEISALPDTVGSADRSAEIIARKNLPPGPELYPVGTVVRVVALEELEAFKKTWKLHHPLQDEQLRFAAHAMRVRSVGYYHGGDVLYTLDGADGFTWHEQTLRSADDA